LKLEIIIVILLEQVKAKKKQLEKAAF